MTVERKFVEESDPTAVIMRQDQAFKSDQLDMEMWLSTLFYPVVIPTAGQTIILANEQDAITELNRLDEMARQEGCVRLKTRILSHLRPAPDLAILCSIRERLAEDDRVLATTSVTWTLIRIGEGWRVNQIIFDDYQFDRSISSLLPRNPKP